MAKQTINIGASPNDGTGTPLRTAFDYTNQNFTELYTATGPSGNNIVVPGSATITGDLTVRTNKLKVDASGVGVGTTATTTGGGAMVVEHASNNGLVVNSTAGSPTIYLRNTADANPAKLFFTDNGLTFANVTNGTLMTLNATGLGIGLAPIGGVKLSVAGTIYANAGNALILDNPSSNFVAQIKNTGSSLQSTLAFLTGSGTSMLIDNSGNVGIGVTPSAINVGRGLEVGAVGNGLWCNNSSYNQLLQNAYNTSISATGWRYAAAASTPAVRVQLGGGEFNVYNAVAGTAGNDLTWTHRLTLDASGYLLIGTTDTAFTSGAGYKFGPGATPSSGQVGASSSNGDLTYRLYSTGAAAYRFYVGFGGTVFATNTTISAISDARLKENVQDIDVGLGAILALKPRKFDWKAGKGKDIKGDRGFIAQEFEQVFPQLVDNWADPAPEGETPYKSVRQDLIPVLVKAIQELAAEVNALKNA